MRAFQTKGGLAMMDGKSKRRHLKLLIFSVLPKT
jgi:hypothetical protein